MRVRTPGTYLLIMHAPRTIVATVGALGQMTLPAGYYVYVGSALGGLWQRLARHLSTSKRHHWHIDYLLDAMPIIDIWYREAIERVECTWAQALMALESLEPVDHIGASDCSCRTHLFRSDQLPQGGWFQSRPVFDGIQHWVFCDPPQCQGIPNDQG